MGMVVRRLLDFISVRPCVSCGKPVPLKRDVNLCEGCADVVKRRGMHLSSPKTAVVSVLPYEKHARMAMFKFKFRNKKYYGYTFGRILSERLKTFDWWSDIDCIVCIPMKGRNRAYNQSAVIAEQVCEETNKPFNEKALIKVKKNPPFYTLKYEQRMRYIKDAFKIVDYDFIKGKNVLVIDDIYTSGTTLRECRRLLLVNGAQSVYCATVCYRTGIKK